MVTPQHGAGRRPEALPMASAMCCRWYFRNIVPPEFANEIEKIELSSEFSKTKAAVRHCNFSPRPQQYVAPHPSNGNTGTGTLSENVFQH